MSRNVFLNFLYVVLVICGLLISTVQATAATITINSSQGSQSVSTGDEVIVTGTGIVTATSSASGIAGGSSDNVAVTVQNAGQIIAQGYVNGWVAGKGIYLGNNASIMVNSGGLVKNLGKDPSGEGSIAGNAIYVGNNATINVMGTVLTDKYAGGYNNWSQGISAGSGSTITVGGSGLVSSTTYGGKSIFFRSGSGNVINLYGNASLNNDLANDGTAGGAIINFGYTGSTADDTANTTISGKIGSTGNAWNGHVYGGTNTVTSNASFKNLQIDAGTELSIGGTLTTTDTVGVGVNSSTSFGHITSTGNITTDGSTLNVIVGGYIPNNTTLTIMNGAVGSSYDFTGINSNNPYFSFSGSDSGGVYTLTASSLGFASTSATHNQYSVGVALDNLTNPTGDMTTVLDALSNLTSADSRNSALNTLFPTADDSTPQVTHETLGNFVGAVSSHLNNLRLAQTSDETGVSTGDEPAANGVWAQGFGTFLHQNPQGSSNGYNAVVYGTAIGYDRLINSDLRLGGSFGYANDNISSKDNSNHTDIDSYQATLYAGLTKSDIYLNGAFSFAYNCYDSLRNIIFPGINRRANSNYGGQQYDLYFEGGHGFKYGKLELTPLASIEYEHLNINSYTEKDADALNLTVNRQGYNMVQSGLGAKAAYSFEGAYGTFIPELHVKWLYDIVNDNQQSTSTFTGGGASFPTQSFRPSRSSANVGTKLTLVTKYNIEISLDYDFQAKEDFYGHSGYVNVRYSF